MASASTISRVLLMLANAFGVSLDDVLARHGVDKQLLDDQDARVPGQLDMDLFDALAERTNEPALGVKIALLPRPPSFDLADYAARNSPDLGSGYRCLLRHQRLLFDHPPLELKVDDQVARLIHHAPPLSRVSRHATECLLGMMLVHGRALTGVDWAPLSVSLRDPAPPDDAPYRRLFRVAVEFAQPVTEIVFDRSVLAYANQAADPALYAVLEHHAAERVQKLASENSFLDEARREIGRLMRGSVPRAADVARRLGMSTRTLHHRLRGHQRTYQQLIDDVRLAMASAYLADARVKCVEVAFMLGFSDASAFYRAFRRWTGKTPIEYRAASAR
jgi:AraC-like DNA-binding protein